MDATRSKKVLFCPTGSLDDLPSSLGIARELKSRGHQATIAGPGFMRDKVLAAGLAFQPLPVLYDPHDPWGAFKGIDFHREPQLFQQRLDERMEQIYTDTLRAAQGADLLLSTDIAHGVPPAAHTLGLPWASLTFSPFSFFSACDPPTLDGWTPLPGGQLPLEARALFKPNETAVGKLYRRLGLSDGYDWAQDRHSPHLVLALFDELLGRPQSDWPVRTVQTGFVADELDAQQALPSELQKFLDDGPPPIVFTLGLSAALIPPGVSTFFEESARAVEQMDSRAVLVCGKNSLSCAYRNVMCIEQAPIAPLFSRARAVVHAGSVSTTWRGVMAGLPSLIVPFTGDQPDNAARLRRLGIGQMVSIWEYSTQRAFHELTALLNSPTCQQRLREISSRLASQKDGAVLAADAIEHLLA